MSERAAQCTLVVQATGYLCAFLLSLCVCVPMAMHQEHFRGRCLLFSTGEWQEVDGKLRVDWASQAYCNFTIFVAVVMFVVSLGQFVRMVKYLVRGRDASFFAAFVDVLAAAFLCTITLIAAVFVTCGFRIWCEQMTMRFETCADAAGNDIDSTSEGIDSSGFFIQMFTAQFGIWASFTCFFSVLVFSIVKLCRYHHQENLRVSMAKERKRLLNEDLVSDVPVTAGAASSSARAGGSSSGAEGGSSRSKRKRKRRLGAENSFEEVDNDVDDDDGAPRAGKMPFSRGTPDLLNDVMGE